MKFSTSFPHAINENYNFFFPRRSALILVYDYHPGSQTLMSKYFTPTQNGTNGYSDPFSGEARPFSHKSSLQRTANGPILQESEIWSIIIQLTCGLRAIHQANLACR